MLEQIFNLTFTSQAQGIMCKVDREESQPSTGQLEWWASLLQMASREAETLEEHKHLPANKMQKHLVLETISSSFFLFFFVF
jgi:hypothetical protein